MAGFLNNGMMTGIGQGVGQATDNLMRLYMFKKQQEQEAARMLQQKAVQDAQIQETMAQAAERKRQTENESAMRAELQGLVKPGGMMSDPSVDVAGSDVNTPTTYEQPGTMPTMDQYLNVLSKYKPEQALTARVSLANTEDRLKSQEKISEERNKAMREALAARLESAIEILGTRTDAAAKMQEAKLQSTLDAIRAKGEEQRQTNQEKPPVQKAPPGYRFTDTEDLEAIPGGPADVKRQEVYTKATQARDSITSNLDMVGAKVAALLKHPGLGRITGVMGAIPNMPGSDAANAKAALDSLKASVGLDTLVSLKQGSGAGLGQVTEAEHKLLQNYITALDQAQSEKAMKKSLADIAAWTAKAKDRVTTAYETRFGEKKAGPSPAPANSSSGAKSRFTIRQVN